MSPPKLALNAVAGLAGFYAFGRFVAAPLYQLLHLGVRPHGSLTEDPEFYYGLIAYSLIAFGEGLGITVCILGIGCAVSSPLGFAVPPAERVKARTWFWYAPVFFFSLEVIGRFQVQRWYAERGILFPFTSFLCDFAPHLWWLAAVWLATAPAILTGRGIYHLLRSPRPAPLPPS